MPVQLSVTVRGAKLVSKNFEDLTKEIPEISKGRMYGRMVSAKTKITRYPPPYEGPLPGGFKSEKQRRFFFWALREGVIQVPYKRTGTYGRAWRIQKIKDGWRLFGRAVYKGKDATKWISGGARGELQARVHQGRWTPIRQAVEESLEKLPKEITESISMVARRKGLNAV